MIKHPQIIEDELFTFNSILRLAKMFEIIQKLKGQLQGNILKHWAEAMP